MPIPYRTKINKRGIGSEFSIVAEQHVVGISGAFTSTPNKIRLVEVPLQESPSTVTIPGFTEVAAAPGPFEFVVDYGIGRITFNAARSGDTVFVSYKGRGSEVDSEDVNELQIPVGIALNDDGTLTDGIVRPSNISTLITDDFVFPRDVTANDDLIAGNNITGGGDITGGGFLTVVTNITTTTGNISAGGTTLSLNTAQVGAPTLDAYLTVERGSSGDVSLRWNETNDAWEFLNDVGSPIFQIFNSGGLSFGGPLLIGDGTVSDPAYSFASEPDLGFYKVSSGVLAFVNASAPTFTIGSTIESHFRHLFVDGTVAAPGISFSSEATGWYLAAPTNPALSVAGVQTLDVNVPTGYLTSALSFLVPSGTVSLPSLSFSADSDTGLYNGAPDQLNVTLGGVNTVTISPLAVESAVKYLAPDGTDLAPSYAFSSFPGTGLSLSTGGNELVFSIDGAGEVLRFTASGDLRLQTGKKLIFDGISGDAFFHYLAPNAILGQSASDTSLTLQSPSYFSLHANAFATGLATGFIRIVNYSALSGATVTIDGTTLTEGVEWFATIDNATTATSLSDAITPLLTVDAFNNGTNVITVLAASPGTAGNSITMATSDPTNILLSGATLLGGGDANTAEPSIRMNGGFVNVNNSSQGDDSIRSLNVRISEGLDSGSHRTFKIAPVGLGLGTPATATVVIFDYTQLAGATLTVDGIILTELTPGGDWEADVDNNTTAASLALAINTLTTTVTAVANLNVITITAVSPGIEGNDIQLLSSDHTNLIISGGSLHDGADDFVVALGYNANGSIVTEATIDTHNSLPLSVTIDDVEVVNVAPTVVTVEQPVNMAGNQINAVADPTAAQDVATKAYVDSVAAGFDPKASVRLATTAAGTLASDFENGDTLDGLSLVTGDRILIKNQADPLENGIYTVNASGAPTRSSDMDGTPANEVSGGNFTFVEQGTVNTGTGWVVLGGGVLTIGVDPINWTQFSHSGVATSFNTVASDPGSPVAGQVWFNTVDNQFKGYNGSSIVIIG